MTSGAQKTVQGIASHPISAPTTQDDWIMKANPTPYWKFFLEVNFFKGCQLDFVEKKGDVITVGVQSGKRTSFRIGEFKGSYTKAKGIRDFTLKSTVGPKQKVIFRETDLQMPEEWWDELAARLDASENGLFKVLKTVVDVLEVVTKI